MTAGASTTLDGRRILVTGAASGLGAAICAALAGAGAALAMVDRREDVIDSARGIPGSRAVGICCDVTDLDSLGSAVMSADEQMGGLDGVIAVAGRGIVGTMASGTPALWRDLIDLNLVAPLATVRFGLERFGSTGRRDIVLIGSTSGLTPTACLGIYSAAKRGLQAAADALRREVAPTGVNVSLVMPGLFDTAGVRAPTFDGEILPEAMPRFAGEITTPPDPASLGQTVAFMLGLPEDICLNEVVIRSTGQLDP